MAETVLTEVTRNLEAEYFNLGTSEEPQWTLGRVFTQLDENANPITTSRHYTVDKNATKKTTGFEAQHPFSLDMYSNDDVSKKIRDIIEEQQLGITLQICKVRLYEPTDEGPEHKKYYARLINVAVEGNKTGTPGELVVYSGNFNQQGDLVVGDFDTSTSTFTPKAAAAAASTLNLE